MRLAVALLTLALGAPGLALAEGDELAVMPDYRTYMHWCLDYGLDEAKTNGHDSEDVTLQAVVAIRCQCEFEHLPNEGETVPPDRFERAMQACDTEFHNDVGAAVDKYKSHLQPRLGELD